MCVIAEKVTDPCCPTQWRAFIWKSVIPTFQLYQTSPCSVSDLAPFPWAAAAEPAEPPCTPSLVRTPWCWLSALLPFLPRGSVCSVADLTLWSRVAELAVIETFRPPQVGKNNHVLLVPFVPLVPLRPFLPFLNWLEKDTSIKTDGKRALAEWQHRFSSLRHCENAGPGGLPQHSSPGPALGGGWVPATCTRPLAAWRPLHISFRTSQAPCPARPALCCHGPGTSDCTLVQGVC